MHHTPIPFWVHLSKLEFKEMLRLTMSPTRGVSHIGLFSVLLVHEKIKYPLPAACLSHCVLPVAVGLLFSSQKSTFILPTDPGAPALPETFVPTPCLTSMGLPCMGAVAVSLS